MTKCIGIILMYYFQKKEYLKQNLSYFIQYICLYKLQHAVWKKDEKVKTKKCSWKNCNYIKIRMFQQLGQILWVKIFF